MSGYGYPHNSPGYGYGGAPPPSQPPYGQPPSSQPPYGQPPSSQPPYGQPHSSHAPYGQSPYGQPPYGQSPTAPPSYGGDGGKPPKENKPPKDNYGGGGSHNHSYGGGHGGGYGGAPAYGSPFAAVLPSTFPPGTDPSIVACFQMADQDGSGLIDDKELQRALSSYNQSFSLRTVHLLMYLFTDSNSRKIGPKEFISLYYSLQSWREIFERFDRDRSGKIDTSELREALYSLGFSVSPVVLDLLVAKFDKTGGHSKAIEYDNFIECCLTVKGLTEKFKAKDKAYTGTATFSYEEFMLTVLPFLIA